jgi:hypothetical protein
MRFGMSLSLCCQLDGTKEAGRENAPAAPVDLAPGPALGSLSSVALSSAQATPSIPWMAPLVLATQEAPPYANHANLIKLFYNTLSAGMGQEGCVRRENETNGP